MAGSAPLPRGGQSDSNPALAAPFEPAPAVREGGEEDKRKHKKRGIFGLGKKKGGDEPLPPLPPPKPTETAPRPPAKDVPVRKTTSPIQTDHSFMLPASPGRGALSALSSPAGSQIFERDVQESAASLMPNSPAIPSHINTENYIPPVLDASSEAITDDHLDPDSVEIITHTGHQPAAVTVTGAGAFDAASNVGGNVMNLSGSWADELASSFAGTADDSASNYGSLDTTDVRRLSFISFADVVQAEQQHQHQHQQATGHVAGSRDSMHLAGLTMMDVNRSPSPIRSPVSSQGPGTSPPTSKSGSVKGLELSPSRKPLGSPTITATSVHSHPTVAGELTIETMSQALRRTGSADLSAVRSLPTSPVEGPAR